MKKPAKRMFLYSILLIYGISLMALPTTTNAVSETQSAIASLRKGLQDKVPYADISLSFSPEPALSVDLNNSASITHFGSYIYYLVQETDKVLDTQLDLTMTLYNIRNEPVQIYRSSETGYGRIMDYRDGSKRIFEIKDLDALIGMYPAMTTVGIGSAVSEENLLIYNQVMDFINSDFTKPEDDLLAEIAPKYGMTMAELKQFLKDIMKKIYSR